MGPSTAANNKDKLGFTYRVLVIFAGDVVAEVVGDVGDGGEADVGAEAVPGAAPHAYLAVSVASKEAVVGDGQ